MRCFCGLSLFAFTSFHIFHISLFTFRKIPPFLSAFSLLGSRWWSSAALSRSSWEMLRRSGEAGGDAVDFGSEFDLSIWICFVSLAFLNPLDFSAVWSFRPGRVGFASCGLWSEGTVRLSKCWRFSVEPNHLSFSSFFSFPYHTLPASLWSLRLETERKKRLSNMFHIFICRGRQRSWGVVSQGRFLESARVVRGRQPNLDNGASSAFIDFFFFFFLQNLLLSFSFLSSSPGHHGVPRCRLGAAHLCAARGGRRRTRALRAAPGLDGAVGVTRRGRGEDKEEVKIYEEKNDLWIG